MAATLRSLGIDKLGFEERLALAGELWDNITAENPGLPLTAAQVAELDQRIADHASRPGETETWDSARAAIGQYLKG